MVCLKLQIILLILFRDALMIDTNDTSGYRKERVNGHIVKLNSNKPNTIHCDEEGFQPDQEDCTIYYRCVKANNDKYNTFRFQCPAGTVFDTHRGICNYPQMSVEHSGCKIPSEEQRYDNKIKDTDNELPKPIVNRDGISYYNPLPNYNELSDYYEKVPYQHAYPVTPSTVAYSTETYTQRPSFLVENEHDDNRCTTDGFMGDSKNCKKFYRCVSNLRGGFIRYEFMCNDATIWDDNTQGCNHAWIARNLKCIKDDTYNDINDINLGFGNKNNYDKNLDQKKDSDDFPNNYNQPHNEPIQTTTEKYIKLDSTTRTEKPYNKPTLSSVQIHKFGDKILGYGDSAANSFTTDSLKEPYSDKYKSEMCSGNGFFGYPGDCKKFYRCIESSNGKYVRYDFSCSDGTVWDDHLKTCNFAWAVKECGSFVPLRDETKDVTTTNINVLSSTVYTSSSRPPKDELFGQTTPNNQEILTKPSTLSDIGASVTYDSYQEECNSNGFYGDKNNCQNFYRCIETRRGVFTKLAYKCGEGTLWDPSIEACNHAWAVKNCTVSVANSQTIADTPVITTVSLIQTTTQANEILEHNFDSLYNQGPNKFTGTTPKDINNFENNVTHNKCTSSGFIGDANDCQKFYRCVDNGSGKFTQYEFTCGDNTVWDSSIESCNHAWAVEKCGGVETVQSQPTTHGNDLLSEENISDSKGTTAPDSSYSISTTRTSEVDEENKPYKPTPQTETGQQPQLPTTTTTTKIPLTSDQNEQVSTSSSNKCTEEGYFGNVEDCKKFYRCVDNGKAGLQMYEYSCGEDTIWDQDIRACNHPQDVEQSSCSTSSQTLTNNDPSITSELPTSKVSSTSTVLPATTIENTYSNHPSNEPSTTGKPYQQSTSSSDTINSVDENTCSKEGYFGNTEDCGKFYRCVDNGKNSFTKYDFTCGEGTIWDQDIIACNHPQDVEHPSCSSNVSSAESTTTEKQTEVPSSTTAKISTSSSTISTTQATTTTSSPIRTSTTPKTSTSTATSATPSSDTINSVDENTCSKEGYYGNTEDCRKFYRCVDNGKNSFTKYDFTCGDGTIWDQDIIACNHPQDVEHPSCSSNVSSAESTTTEKQTENPSSTTAKISTSSSTISNIQTTTTTSSPTSTSTTPKTTTTSSTPSSTSSSSTATTESSTMANNENQTSMEGQEKGNFTCTKAGFYPNPNDCKKFYRCVDWYNNGTSFSIFHFDCGEGTIWDPSLDTCNYEDSVYPPRNCNGSSIQTQNNTESTTSGSSSTDTTTTPASTAMTTSEPSTTEESSSTSTTEQSSSTSTTEQSSSTSTTEQSSSTSTTEQSSSTSTTEQSSSTSTTEQSSSTQTSTTTEQQTSTTEKSTTQTEASSTEQSTTATSDSTTTERSTTPMDQTDKTTAESSTSESTTQSSSTEQQSTSNTDSSSEPTDSDKTTTEATQQTTESTTSSTPKDKCPEMNDDQYAYVCPTSFRRHPKYCNLFYQCTEDDDSHDLKIALFHCPNNTIYDESKTQCVDENKASKKCDGTLARTHRIKRFSNDYIDPIIVGTDSYACPNVGYFPFEKNQECSQAMLKCQRSRNNNLTGYVFRCPEGYSFWSKSKRCERNSRIKDCKRSIYPWNKRHDIPKEVHNVALY